MTTNQAIQEEAATFVTSCYEELGKSGEETHRRLADVREELSRRGTYELTYEELAHGARMAWRNSNRCIGRLFWPSLNVFDERGLEREDDIAEAIFRHIAYGTNGGMIRPSITVFAAETGARRIRIWNHQLIRYAGYETGNGIVGDPASVRFTKACMSLGWRGAGTPFDVLPLVVQVNGRQPRWYPIPDNLVMEVPIQHPEYDSFAGLGLKWYAVPFISDMLLDIGGIRYTAAPFNGWYMGTEIGARNLADPDRYHMLPKVAELLKLDTSTNVSLWKDRALVELNAAVLHSFKAAGVSIIDHHTAAEQFRRFEQQEERSGRPLTGDWTWLIPPVSPAATHIFHRSYDDRIVKPNYFRQACPYDIMDAGEAGVKADPSADVLSRG